MNLLVSFLRLLTIGNPSGKRLAIRVIGMIVLVVILVIWGVNYRNQTPAVVMPGQPPPTSAARSDFGEITLSNSVSSTLAKDERHVWTFVAEESQRVTIRVLGDWDSTLEIIPQNGTAAIAGDYNSSGSKQALLCSYVFRRAGVYSVVVSGYLGADPNYGDYTLQIEPEEYFEERPIQYGETVEGRLTTCDGDFYTFAVETGDQVRMTLTPEDAINMSILVYPARNSDELVAISQSVRGDDGIMRDILTFEALRDNMFYINIDSAVGEPEGAYTLVVDEREKSAAPEEAA